MIGPLVAIWKDPALRLACAVLMLCGAVIASIAPYLSLIGVQIFGFSDQIYSAIFATAAITGLAASIYVGIYTDQRSKRRLVALVCAALMFVGGLAIFLWPSRATFLLTHLLIWPVAFTLFSQVFALARLAASAHAPETRDAILAAVRATFALSFIIVLPFWALAFTKGVDVMVIYAFATFVSVICILVIAKSWPVDGNTQWGDPKSGLSFGQSLREITNGRVLGRVMLTGTISAGASLQMVLTALLFHQAANRDASDTALFAGLIAGLEVPFMLGMSFLLARFRKTKIIAGGALVYALFLCIFALSVEQPWVWFLTIPAAMGAAVILSVPIAYLQDLMADRPGAGGSLLAINNVVGQIVAAVIFAVGTFVAGYTATAIVGAVIVTLAAISLLVVEREGA